jgi:type VI secretion system protein ImpB
MSSNGSTAPKERVNIVYRPATDGASAEVELPLKLLVLGEYASQANGASIEDTKPVNIDKTNFNDVLKGQNISLQLSVPNRLDDKDNDESMMPISLNIESMDDFSPDAIVEKVPELQQMIALRDALKALKGPLGNIPEFRNKLQELIADDEARAKLLSELNLSE